MSPVSHRTIAFDVHDAKVYPLLTDAAGASPTYGAGLDVFGVRTVSVNPGLVTAELKGDARIVARRGRTERYDFSVGYDKIDLDVLNTIQGSGAATPVADTGTAGTAVATYRAVAPNPLPYFRLEFKIDDLDPGLGSLKVTLWKCQLSGAKLLSTSSDAFNQPSFDGQAIATEGTLGTDVGVLADFALSAAVVALDP